MNEARPERRVPGRTHHTDLVRALRELGVSDALSVAAVRDVVADVAFDDIWIPWSRGYVALARAGTIHAWIHPGFVDVRSGPGGAHRIALPAPGPARLRVQHPDTRHDGTFEEAAMTTDPRAASVQGEPRGERLLGAVRRERIVAAVRARGVVTVADLVRDLGVSDMTVRRDLAALADRGLLHRVHGGATSAGRRGSVHVPRPGVPRAGDDARAEVAVRLIEPGGVVALGPGTTTRLLAERIVADPRLRPLTVLTSSTAVARVVDSAGDGLLTAILSGGTRTASDALVGPLARRAFGELPSTLVFVDAYRISSDTGVADQGRDEADVSRAMVQSTDRVVVLASRSAWRPGGGHPFAALDEVDVLVTDDAAPARERERAGSAAGHLLVAPAGQPPPARRPLVRG
ncbi:DeoR/GlpR family DNA-binding transcription regulator [Cellulosimicrobium cellulans]|uniref:DeoR/GlpR family DNA-binding transcription regulator n=1 Tax=Cellulosimicrobium cellulans TaxID=1710 RepID=UPI00364B9364